MDTSVETFQCSLLNLGERREGVRVLYRFSSSSSPPEQNEGDEEGQRDQL